MKKLYNKMTAQFYYLQLSIYDASSKALGIYRNLSKVCTSSCLMLLNSESFCFSDLISIKMLSEKQEVLYHLLIGLESMDLETENVSSP